MLPRLVFLFGLFYICSARWPFCQKSEWNGLKVTWGLDPATSFQDVPRTRRAARAAGWTKIGSASCHGNAKFRGERYMKGNDRAVIPIFDRYGRIAGMQAGVPVNYTPNPNNFPNASLINKPLVLDGDYYYVTAYFQPPDTVCSRSWSRRKSGTGLWIQNGTDPITDSFSIPMTQTEVEKTAWTIGACFVTMGQHFWYNQTVDGNCDDIFPVSLLYNGGKLTGFLWVFGMELGTDYSTRMEYPPLERYPLFLALPIPTCLATYGTLTFLHVFLKDSDKSEYTC